MTLNFASVLTARRLALGGVLALLGCLAWSAAHGPHRLEQLRRAVTHGQLAALSEADRTTFLATVRWLAAAAGAAEPVTVNEEPLAGRLRVYVTTPALAALTGCHAGNAVYDSELDAIFIDRDLLDVDKYLPMIDASGYGSVLSPRREIPFARAYLRFVVLHELGHRQLKHATASRWRPIRDDFEAAADRFALDRMMRAFESGTRFGFRVLEEPLELSALPGDGTVKQRTWLELAEMAGGVNLVSLFHAGAYGPFYQDRLHRNFITRSRGMIAAARSEDLPATIRDQLEVVDRALQRQLQSLDVVRWQVTSPNPIGDLAFGKDGVVIASTGLRTASVAPVEAALPKPVTAPSRR